MSEHTPGPWKIAPDPHYSPSNIVAGSAVYEVRNVVNGSRAPRAEDLRLIAAAPESHEANVESLRFLEGLWKAYMDDRSEEWLTSNYNFFNNVTKANRAAIAKAKGDE